MATTHLLLTLILFLSIRWSLSINAPETAPAIAEKAIVPNASITDVPNVAGAANVPTVNAPAAKLSSPIAIPVEATTPIAPIVAPDNAPAPACVNPFLIK